MSTYGPKTSKAVLLTLLDESRARVAELEAQLMADTAEQLRAGERLSAAVAEAVAKEREACAKLVEGFRDNEPQDPAWNAYDHAASAIRERGSR